MTAYKAINETIQSEFQNKKTGEYDYSALKRAKLVSFRKSASIQPIDHPTNLARARNLGYKAKQGVSVVRVKIRRGGGLYTRPSRHRRPKRMGINKLTRKVSIQSIAEGRAAKKHPNLEVLNSYYVGEDGMTKYYEVILVDSNHPVIKSDKELSVILKNRIYKGRTSAGKKQRGLIRGINHLRSFPSIRAKGRLAK